jgi:hypothetical protein
MSEDCTRILYLDSGVDFGAKGRDIVSSSASPSASRSPTPISPDPYVLYRDEGRYRTKKGGRRFTKAGKTWVKKALNLIKMMVTPKWMAMILKLFSKSTGGKFTFLEHINYIVLTQPTGRKKSAKVLRDLAQWSEETCGAYERLAWYLTLPIAIVIWVALIAFIFNVWDWPIKLLNKLIRKIFGRVLNISGATDAAEKAGKKEAEGGLGASLNKLLDSTTAAAVATGVGIASNHPWLSKIINVEVLRKVAWHGGSLALLLGSQPELLWEWSVGSFTRTWAVLIDLFCRNQTILYTLSNANMRMWEKNRDLRDELSEFDVEEVERVEATRRMRPGRGQGRVWNVDDSGKGSWVKKGKKALSDMLKWTDKITLRARPARTSTRWRKYETGASDF